MSGARSGDDSVLGLALGAVVVGESPIIANRGCSVCEVAVLNSGDRPIQVGSHYHFAEVNDALVFDRSAASGMRLDIPAGTSARFEPGTTRVVRLASFGGAKRMLGFRRLDPGASDA